METILRWLMIGLGHLPLFVMHGLAAVLGSLFWVIPNTRRDIALRHLDLCLPELAETDRRRIARQSLIHLAKALLESPAIWFGPEARLRRWIDSPGAAARLGEVAAQGGTIVLCPHIGSWELAGMFCASLGPITSLYKPQKGVIDDLILEGRRRLGAHLVPTSGAGVRALLAALKAGQMIGVLPDQDPPRGSGVFAPLFGIPAHTTELVAKLAVRTQAPVWFCYAERLPWARGFRFHVSPMSMNGVGDAAEGTARMNRAIESVLTHLPEQYWWSYKRFRRLPEGMMSPYSRK
ncbi:MAG: lysophospholipid acyltransferase family protein [Panacagrimonas sp.]